MSLVFLICTKLARSLFFKEKCDIVMFKSLKPGDESYDLLSILLNRPIIFDLLLICSDILKYQRKTKCLYRTNLYY